MVSAAAAEFVFVDDFETIDCTNDRDGDRLNDCVETGTGVFVSASNTGTQRAIADSDGDGLKDGDEVLGTTGGLNLPAFGVHPLHRDLLVEIDWVFDNYADPQPNCEVGSHQPTANAVQLLQQMFQGAPLANDQGGPGINIIVDYGQGGVFSGGNLVDEDDGVIEGVSTDPAFVALKAANFAANREGYFRYGLMAHRFVVEGNSLNSGHGAILGSDFMTALYCKKGDYNQASVIAHELGHGLGLKHGGFEDCGYKPNYSSIMNYRYQFYGIDADCKGQRGPVGANPINFSTGERVVLNESGLVEQHGVCGAPAIDWNNNFVATDIGIAVNVNSDEKNQTERCGGTFTELHDFDDWQNVVLAPPGPNNSPPLEADEVLCEAIPPIAQ